MEKTLDLLRIAEVARIVRRGKSTVYADMAANLFPRPVRIGRRAVAWRQADIADWLAERPAA